MVNNTPAGPLEKVRMLARYILDAIAQGKETSYYYLIVIHAAIIESASDNKSGLMRDMDEPIKVFVDILEEGQKNGEIAKGSAQDMALVFFFAVQGIAVSRLMMQNSFKMPDSEILVNIVKS